MVFSKCKHISTVANDIESNLKPLLASVKYRLLCYYVYNYMFDDFAPDILWPTLPQIPFMFQFLYFNNW